MAMVGWVAAGMKVVDTGLSQEGLVACQEMLEQCLSSRWCTDDTRSHRFPGAKLWALSRQNWSVFRGKPQHGMPRDGSGSLSMQLVGYTPWCYTDSCVVVNGWVLWVLVQCWWWWSWVLYRRLSSYWAFRIWRSSLLELFLHRITSKLWLRWNPQILYMSWKCCWG